MSHLVEAPTIGRAWMEIAAHIMAQGSPATYDGRPILEVAQVTLEVAHPDPDDELIARNADPERLAWMRANFLDRSLVAELGDARSYASRLRDYGGVGRDQVEWVIARLRADPQSRSATITTFEPLIDTTYIPCVSMLDFWAPAGSLELVVYAHSIDFGSKGYGNLVQLAAIQQEVASALGLEVGSLTFVIKSAHVYDTEFDYMRGVLAHSS